MIIKILCHTPLILYITELKNLRPNIGKILGHLYLYQILKIIGVYLYSEYLVIHCIIEITLLAKLPLPCFIWANFISKIHQLKCFLQIQWETLHLPTPTLIKHMITFFDKWHTSAIFVSFDNFKTLKNSQFWRLIVDQKSRQVWQRVCLFLKIFGWKMIMRCVLASSF